MYVGSVVYGRANVLGCNLWTLLERRLEPGTDVSEIHGVQPHHPGLVTLKDPRGDRVGRGGTATELGGSDGAVDGLKPRTMGWGGRTTQSSNNSTTTH